MFHVEQLARFSDRIIGAVGRSSIRNGSGPWHRADYKPRRPITELGLPLSFRRILFRAASAFGGFGGSISEAVISSELKWPYAESKLTTGPSRTVAMAILLEIAWLCSGATRLMCVSRVEFLLRLRSLPCRIPQAEGDNAIRRAWQSHDTWP
jgi:hypothetical protein